MTEEQKKIQFLIDAFHADDDYRDFKTADEYFQFHENRSKDLCAQDAKNRKKELIQLGKRKNKDIKKWLSALNQYAIAVGRHSNKIYEVFIELYQDGMIPDSVQFPLLMNIYVQHNVETGFNKYLLQMYKDYPDELKEIIQKETYNKIKEYADKDGYFTVYRGEYIEAKYGTSVKLDSAISFTFDYKKARFFACRWNPQKANIYTAKVTIDDIIFYTDERNEKEVIIRPEIEGGRLLDLKCEEVNPEEYGPQDRSYAQEVNMRMALEKGFEI